MTAVTRWRVASLLLLCICLLLAYRVFDQGITRTYLDASMESSASQAKLLTNLIEEDWRGMPRDQVFQRLSAFASKQPQNSVVLKREQRTGAILFEDLHFEFTDGKLHRIRHGE